MGHKLLWLQLPRLHDLEQHRGGRGVNQAGRDGDVAIPELLEVQVDRFAVNADVRDSSARGNDRLADLEGGRYTDRLDGDIDASAVGQRHHALRGVAVGAVDQRRCAERPGDLQPLVVEIDHEDRRRRIELRGQQHREPDRPGADDRHAVSGLHLPVQDAAFKAGRQDVAEHHQRFLIGVGRDGVQARVGVRNAHVLGLRPVDGVAQDPPTVPAVRVHAPPAEVAFAARGHAGDQDLVAGANAGDTGSDALDDADALVSENAPVCDRRYVTLQDVQVRATDRRRRDAHDGVRRVRDRRLRFLFPGTLAWTVIDEGLHGTEHLADLSMTVCNSEQPTCSSGPRLLGCPALATLIEPHRRESARDPVRNEIAQVPLTRSAVQESVSNKRDQRVELAFAQIDGRRQERIDPAEDRLDRAEAVHADPGQRRRARGRSLAPMRRRRGGAGWRRRDA